MEAAESPEPPLLPRRQPRKPYDSTYIKKGLGCLLEEGFKQDGIDSYQCGIDPNNLTATDKRCIQAAFDVSEPADNNRDDARMLKNMSAAYERCMYGRAIEIPKQYHSTWCQTKWKTIYKRCGDKEMGQTVDVIMIDRTSWGWEDQGCTLSTIHKSKYGGHRLFGRWEELTPFPKTKNTAQKNVGGSAPITHDYKS